ncbi:MAG: hypothetical protein ACK4RZ_04560 [Paracoccaceae bacterium]
MRTVFFRVLAGLALIAAVVMSWTQLGQYTALETSAALAAEVREGRSELGDLPRLRPLLQAAANTGCGLLREGSIVTLQLYVVGLHARAINANPLLPAADPDLTAVRRDTRQTLERALACAPLNGEHWLSLALIDRSLGANPAQIATHLQMSERYAPHETWIGLRRDSLF